MRNNRIEDTPNFSLYCNQFERKYDTSLDYADAIFETEGKIVDVDIDNIVSAQDEIDDLHCEELVQANYYDGALGLKFADCDEVFVVDGNHRINSAIISGKTSVEMCVITMEYNPDIE